MRPPYIPPQQAAARRRAVPARAGLSGQGRPASAKAWVGYAGSNVGASWATAFATYEALAVTDDRTPIATLAIGPLTYASAYRFMFAPTVSFQRLRLSAISRYLYDNYASVSYGVDMIHDFSVPVVPMADSGDAKWNELANEFFKDWAKSADYAARFDFWTLQSVACRSIDIDGDIGFILTNERGFPQLQTIEGWRIGILKPARPDQTIIDGVELDEKGAIKGYVLQGDAGVIEVPASVMHLCYDAERYYSYRGLSAIRRGANDSRDRQDIKQFEKKSAKVGSALSAVISGGPVEQSDWNDPNQTGGSAGEGTDMYNQPPSSTSKITTADLLGGDIPVLPAGQNLSMLDNKRPGERVADFMRELAGDFASGLSIPPAFYLDEKLSGPNLRAVMGKAQRAFSRRQDVMSRMVRWVWTRVVADGIARKLLPPVAVWDRVKFQKPPKLVIDLGDQAKNDRDDVAAAHMSRQERFSNRGLDWQRESDQIAAEQEYIIVKAQGIAKKYDVPLEMILGAWGFSTTSTITTRENQASEAADATPEGGGGGVNQDDEGGQ